MEENPHAHVVEMDTVEGVKGGALLLTLHAVAEKTQYAHFIRDKHADNIKPVFDLYRERLNDDNLFEAYFNVILTDNGTEFSDILFLEELGCHVFFCDPYNSGQKGHCEKNHKFIRYYLPKGGSFDWINMNDIWKMMSHINSIKRDSLNGKTPYELTQFIWGKALLDAFHINYIEPEKVIFDKRLFKK